MEAAISGYVAAIWRESRVFFPAGFAEARRNRIRTHARADRYDVRCKQMNAGKPVIPDLVERVERVLMGTALTAGVLWSVLGEAGVWRLASLLRVI